MGYGIAVLLIFAIASSATAKLDQYCSICPDHTMCQYSGTGKACKDIGEGGVTEEDKKLILDLHNHYRRLIARGHETRGLGGAQPSAANLMQLSWDNELAKVAQAWADQCLFQHDACRDVSRWKVGQNIYWSWRFPILAETNWTAAIESWYEEVAKFNPKTVQSYKFESATGHYTQLIWHDTSLIGCGRRNYGPNKIYVCNYGPAGNWIDEPLYNTGEACSQCPTGTFCNDGLCEERSTSRISLESRDPDPEQNLNQNSYNRLIQNLSSPEKNAVDNYVSHSFKKKEQDATAKKYNLIDDSRFASLEEATTTEVPVNFNFVDDLDVINNDEEIKKEIEDLQLRILELVQKIIEKRNSKMVRQTLNDSYQPLNRRHTSVTSPKRSAENELIHASARKL